MGEIIWEVSIGKRFLTAPASFLNFANNQKLRYVKESFD